MPNWCDNVIRISHEDPAMIDRVVKGQESLFMEFFPTPQQLLDTTSGHFGDEDKQRALEVQQQNNIKQFGHKDWYYWNIANWGVKWDIELEDIHRPNDNTLEAHFYSAWRSPDEAYVKLCAMGFRIDAMYNEPGMGFCGKFIGDKNNHYDVGFNYSDFSVSWDGIRGVIVKELDEQFGITDFINEDNDEDDEVEDDLIDAILRRRAAAEEEN